MSTKQTITQKGNCDSAHRVMDERMKCFSLHGHSYLYELTFEFDSMEDIGYAIDFKEIKRVGVKWIDEFLDHGFIANPKDVLYIEAVKQHNNKVWLMSLNGINIYCNPTVENIAKEVFLAMDILFQDANTGLKIKQVKIYETPNCFTDCYRESISETQRAHWMEQNFVSVLGFKEKMGRIEYDARKL